ncbi:hypothetical protein EMIT0P294_90218 [Pseudomonas sp. IT-P294]
MGGLNERRDRSRLDGHIFYACTAATEVAPRVVQVPFGKEADTAGLPGAHS